MQLTCSICQRGLGKRRHLTLLSQASHMRPLFMSNNALCSLVVLVQVKPIYRGLRLTCHTRTSGQRKVIYSHRVVTLVWLLSAMMSSLLLAVTWDVHITLKTIPVFINKAVRNALMMKLNLRARIKIQFHQMVNTYHKTIFKLLGIHLRHYSPVRCVGKFLQSLKEDWNKKKLTYDFFRRF